MGAGTRPILLRIRFGVLLGHYIMFSAEGVVHNIKPRYLKETPIQHVLYLSFCKRILSGKFGSDNEKTNALSHNNKRS